MLSAVLFIGLVGSTLAALEDFTPAQPHVAEYSHSAKIKIDPKDVPDGTNMIHIEAKEINDLTGDRFEAGYEFGYNPAVSYFWYPELTDGKYHVFRVKYGKSTDSSEEWSEYSPETHYLHAESSRFTLEGIERNWAMAKEQCIKDGKRLAVIHGQKTNDMLVKKMLEHKDLVPEGRAWIGLFDEHFNDDNPSTSWVWVDNSHFKFAKFEYGARVGQSELSSAVVAINSEGEWETVSPDQKLPFFCETGVTERAKLSEARVGLSETDVLV